MTGPDLNLAITVNKRDLLLIVAGLVAMLPGATVTRLSRRLYLAVLGGLRPAESILRRLIAMAAIGMTVGPRKARAAPDDAIPRGTGGNAPVFPLFDPRKTVGCRKRTRAPGSGPGIWGFDGNGRPSSNRPAPPADDTLDAASLFRRMAALRAALDDIPGQARRLTRILAWRQVKWKRVMRPGRPPGYRHRGKRPVDMLLANCQEMALRALHEHETPVIDTS